MCFTLRSTIFKLQLNFVKTTKWHQSALDNCNWHTHACSNPKFLSGSTIEYIYYIYLYNIFTCYRSSKLVKYYGWCISHKAICGKENLYFVGIYTEKWVSDIDQCFKLQLILFRSYCDWNKVYQAQWLSLRTRSCLFVGIDVYVLNLSCASPTHGQSL